MPVEPTDRATTRPTDPARPPAPDAHPGADPEPHPETTTDVADQVAVRLEKRARINAEAAGDPGGGAYPVRLPITTSIADVRARHTNLAADARSGERVGIAGRVVHLRNTGKLCFAVFQSGEGERIQTMVSLAEVGEAALASWKELVDLGDHVFVAGEVISSKRGELSVFASEWRMAAKTVYPLPTLHHELSEETRVRARYLDLIVRGQARNTVRDRATVNQSLRATFAEQGFLEVETPMLQTLHGGASARPFVTHSNAFDTDLFLRIAPELYLKRAVVGGLERVFEINRNFRNEGADSTHSPEFAMLEAYQAYSDYHDIADLAQALIQNAARAVSQDGSHVVHWADGTAHDLGGDWDRIAMYPSLSEVVGEEITPETPLARLRTLADAVDIVVPHPVAGKYVEELWEHHVLHTLVRPTFVCDFPVDTSPLVRWHRSQAGVVEKWDLYVDGFELATGYSELVDPVVQRERFVAQARLAAGGDPEAMRLDEDFLRALEHGMPPTGGLGMGIDRLLMALTGLGIRETVLFPLVK